MRLGGHDEKDDRARVALGRWLILEAEDEARAEVVAEALARMKAVRRATVEPERSRPTSGLETIGVERACFYPPLLLPPMEDLFVELLSQTLADDGPTLWPMYREARRPLY